MVIVIAVNMLPTAYVWIWGFIAVFTIILFSVFPIILRRRMRKEQHKLHELNEKARKKILADGKVTRPKGNYIPRSKAGSKKLFPETDKSVPRHNGYDGMPWQ